MNRRIAWILALVCAVVSLIAPAPAAAQESPQTVKAAIPPQTQPPTAAAPLNVPPQARPAVAQPQTPPTLRPDLAPPQKSTSEYEAANVKIEVAITYQVGSAAPVKRMATLTVADGGRGSLRSGNQVAVPSTTFPPVTPAMKPEGGGAATVAPMTSFNYKSIGLNVDANRVFTQGTRTRLDLSVEFSAVDEKSPGDPGRPPSFPTFSQNLTLVLESGKPIIVGQSSDFVDNVERKQTVEVKATILR